MTHDQRPTTNDPGPTTDDRRPSARDQRPTIRGQGPTTRRDVSVNKERRHEFVSVVWTRPGKKQGNAEDDATFAGRRTYTLNVDEMARGIGTEKRLMPLDFLCLALRTRC